MKSFTEMTDDGIRSAGLLGREQHHSTNVPTITAAQRDTTDLWVGKLNFNDDLLFYTVEHQCDQIGRFIGLWATL